MLRTRRLLIALAALPLLALLGLAAVFAWYWHDLPPLDRVVAYQPRQSLQVFTYDGVEIAQYGSERRQFVPIAEVPKQLQDAVLAIEDHTFYEHGAFSGRGIARAVFATLRGRPEGASTITQQVARNFFLSSRFTPQRKIKEALLAWQIEQQLKKPQILELYLNQIYLGQRSYGFASAAASYFGKPLSELTLAENAMLAGLPQNPIWANPIANAARATRRQKMVLDRMLAVGAIDATQHAAAVAEKLQYRRAMQVDLHAEYVAEMARLAVVERFGERAYTDGFRVYTSLRADEQRAARAGLRNALLAHERRQPWRGPDDDVNLPDDALDAERAAAQALKEHRDDEQLRVAVVMSADVRQISAQLASGEVVQVKGEGLRLVQAALSPKAPAALSVERGSVIRVMFDGKNWLVVQWPQAQGAFVALDPMTGRVRALVGGFDFTRQPFNHATLAQRQPGSSFKPFLYSAAIEQGVMPDSLINDQPLTNPDGSTPSWNPKNSDGRYDGPLTLREALARSKNMVSIRLLQQVGLPSARQWIASAFGFKPEQMPENLTMALGSGSTTPLQLASAYAVLANGGWRVAPVLIERITDSRGDVLFQADAPAPFTEASRTLPERNAFVVNQLLAEVTKSGTAANVQAQLGRADLYGKTGTTNDAVDAWFAGFHPSLVAVAWIGHDQPKSLGVGESGGGLALPAWIDFMRVALREVPVAPVLAPEGVVLGAKDWRYSEWAEQAPIERIGVD